MNLNFLALDKPTSKCLLAIIVQVKDHFVPAIIEFQRHGAFEGFYSRDWLIIAWDKGPLDILIVENGDFEPEVFIELDSQMSTFLTSSTKMGSRIFMERFSWLGNAMKLLMILLPLISKTGSSISGSVILLICPFLTTVIHPLPLDSHFSRIFSMDWFLRHWQSYSRLDSTEIKPGCYYFQFIP